MSVSSRAACRTNDKETSLFWLNKLEAGTWVSLKVVDGPVDGDSGISGNSSIRSGDNSGTKSGKQN